MSLRIVEHCVRPGLDIVYEDDWWLVVNKPSGVMSQRGKRLIPNVVDMLKSRYTFLSPVHRLDTNVSGVLVLATSAKAARWFHRQLLQSRVAKFYTAALIPDGEQKLFDQCWINRAAKQAQLLKVYSYFESFTGPVKSCKLRIQTRLKNNRAHVVDIELLTGVFHQIRAQCAYRGMPIIGDVKYGGPALPQRRLALHCQRMSFRLRPNQDHMRSFQAKEPDWFSTLS